MAKAKKKETLSLEEKLERALVSVDEQPYEVPENWCWTRLESIANIKSGTTLPSEREKAYGNIMYIKVADMNSAGNEEVIYSSKQYVDEYDSSQVIPTESVIFPKRGGAILTNKKRMIVTPLLADLNIMAITPKFTCKYFYYWFLGVDLKTLNNGSNVPQINNKDIAPLCFPIAPVAEQQRIVEQIESLFAKLDEAKEKVQDALDSYEIRRASILHNALNGELTVDWRKRNGIGNLWDEVLLGDVADIKSSKRVYKEDYVESGIPFFRSSEVVDLYDTGVTEAIYFITEEKYEEIKREKGVPEEGNLLVTSVGTIGKTWIVDDRKFYYKDGNLTEVVKNDRLNMKFLQMYIMSAEFNNQVIDTVSGSAYNALTIVKFKKIRMKLPSVEEQNEIVRVVGELLKKEQQVRESIEQVLVSIDMMKKSILAKAFRGELGTNNSEEESAVELLKSILNEAEQRSGVNG